MTLKEKLRKALRRTSSAKEDSKPKVEYYREGEVPRSKYRGPLDPELRQRLQAWTFADATMDRHRSFDLDLSPCTTLPDGHHRHPRDADAEPGPFDVRTESFRIAGADSIDVAHHEIAPPSSISSSQSSTLAGSDSTRSSSLTLKNYWDEPTSRKQFSSTMKEAISGTADVTSPREAPAPKSCHIPPTAGGLAGTMNAVHIY